MATFESPPLFRAPFFTLPNGQAVMDEAWSNWFTQLASTFSSAYTGVVPLTKITGGGSDGSLTIVNGLVVSVVAPT